MEHPSVHSPRKRVAVVPLLVVQDEELVIRREMSPQKQSLIVAKIVDFFILKMQGCLEASFRLKIMECFLKDERVSPFLLECYPCGEDAKAQFEFFKNYRLELDAVKGIQSTDMLTKKVVLLDAAISTSLTSTKALSWVLKVQLVNLRVAITRRSIMRLNPKPIALAK